MVTIPSIKLDYLKDWENCKLCEWQCGVDRLAGETGVCQITEPLIASCTLHPAPPESYTIFTAGCNFKCLNCQNYSIAHYPATKADIEGVKDPEHLAIEAIAMIKSKYGSLMGADRLFFSGGEPTIHLPYIEKVVQEARKLDPTTKVNFDTNGFLTKDSLKRVLKFTNSITFDLKAYNDETCRALTGAPVEPILRNAEYVARNAKEKLWEFRILVIPDISGLEETKHLCEFIADINPDLPVCFLVFRPNFILDIHQGAPTSLMDKIVDQAIQHGLHRAYWSGSPNIRFYTGPRPPLDEILRKRYRIKQAQTAATFAKHRGCITHPRDCGQCKINNNCPIKAYKPRWRS